LQLGCLQKNAPIQLDRSVFLLQLRRHSHLRHNFGATCDSVSFIRVFFDAFLKFEQFAITQIPLAIGEGLLAVILFDFLAKYKGQRWHPQSTQLPHAAPVEASEIEIRLLHRPHSNCSSAFCGPLLLFPNAEYGGADGAAEQQLVTLVTRLGLAHLGATKWRNRKVTVFAAGSHRCTYHRLLCRYERGKRKKDIKTTPK
jgi:hypothetical protein